MNRMESHIDRPERSSTPSRLPIESNRLSSERTKHLHDLQFNFLDSVQEMNRSWFACAKCGARLSSAFLGTVAVPRHMPETKEVHERWLNDQLALVAQSGERLILLGEAMAGLLTRSLNRGGVKAAPEAPDENMLSDARKSAAA
jgi:hypothetical protein